MTAKNSFEWHPEARLFCRDQQIMRVESSTALGFRYIAAAPATEALTGLGQAVQRQHSFCVHGAGKVPEVAVEHPNFVTLTGGSTGQPKAIIRNQASWIASFIVNAGLFDLTPDDATAVLGGLSHSLSLYGVLEALHLGLDAYVLAGSSAMKQRQMLADQRVSLIYATPTQMRSLTRSARGDALPHVRRVLCGGGALDATTAHAIHALCPNAQVHVFYGAAETSFITLSDGTTPQGSVGRPYPGVDLRVLDADGRATQGTGLVWVKSPYVFEGYASDQANAARCADGFVTVGEIGRLSSDGLLWLEGRADRMVAIADQNVFPEQIEAFVAALEGVADAAVVAVADRLRGHRLILVIEGAEDQTLAKFVRDACRDVFNSSVTPREVRFIDFLPRLASGKVDLAGLAEWIRKTA